MSKTKKECQLKEIKEKIKAFNEKAKNQGQPKQQVTQIMHISKPNRAEVRCVLQQQLQSLR